MVDVNKPVTNPELVRAIREMNASSSKEKQDQVINEVMKAHFITPVMISPSPEHPADAKKAVIKKNTAINFAMVQNSANQKAFFLAFTDWDELRKWQNIEDQQTLILPFDDLAAMVLDKKSNSDGFVINPYGGNVVFDTSLVKALKEEKERRSNGGAVEQVVKEDTAVQLGQPKVYPQEMVDAVSSWLKRQKNVTAAYLQLMKRDEEYSYLLVVDFTGDKRPVFDWIYKAAAPHLNGMFVDMVPYDSEFGHNATVNVEPFYKRKPGLFK